MRSSNGNDDDVRQKCMLIRVSNDCQTEPRTLFSQPQDFGLGQRAKSGRERGSLAAWRRSGRRSARFDSLASLIFCDAGAILESLPARFEVLKENNYAQHE
jgi:hypothetical protein